MELSPSFCSAVLNGLRKHGMAMPDICRITGLPEADVRRILQEKASLSVRQVRSIERATGLTAGQLAAKSDKSAAEALGALMDQWAEATAPAGRRLKPARKAS